MSQRPSYDVLRINSPLARLLHSYRRLSELSTCYVSLCICVFAWDFHFLLTKNLQVEEERRVAKPVLFLEDVRIRDNNV